ncbi:tetratricopeptide repeat protein [Aliiglaciecola litoralis]|uniref:OmpR/PhoB-type domain-containing protein n=1 Tax=Aliiglaciecola litoralis TaxID=582857 RepID=A0ABN1LD66_9ALTE
MNADLLQGFYLGDMLVQPLKGEVKGKSGTQHLPPKAVEVLLCLASSSGELVTREHLINEVWGQDQGSQEALSHAISEIRHVFNDNRHDPIFLQTLPKRGYRLLIKPQIQEHDPAASVFDVNNNVDLIDIGLFENLKQRGIFETAVAYMIFGWLLIQIADIVFGQLHFPAWVGTFVTLLVIGGFPIALILSWFLEIRIERTKQQLPAKFNALKWRISRTYISILGALGLAGLLVFAYDQNVGLPEPVTPEEIELAKLPPIVENSFAVLPFFNLDGSERTGVFANGLVDDVITRLAMIPGLRVSSRGDSYTLNPNTSSQRVRERLRVEMYLAGSVELAEDVIKVKVQMIDSETGFQVLSRQFAGPSDDFFTIRDQITSLTVANLRVALPPDTRSIALLDHSKPTIDAYILYRRGVEVSRLPMSISNINTALEWYNQALIIDQDYAAAHAGKCDLFVSAFREVNDITYMQKAESSCGIALNLNPNLDVVHTSLGRLYAALGRYTDAETSYQKALAIDPYSVSSLVGLGNVYRLLNEPQKAEQNLRNAIGLKPGDPIAYFQLGRFLFSSGKFAEAAEQYQHVVALQADNMNAYNNLGSAYMMAGKFELAAPAYERALSIEPTRNGYSNLGLMYYYLGNLDAAIFNHNKAVKLSPLDHLARSNLGDALYIAGRKKQATDEFKQAEELVLNALQVNQNDPFLMMDLSWIYTMLGKLDLANVTIRRVIELAPDDPYSHYYSGLVSLYSGDRKSAIQALKQAVDLGYPPRMIAVEPHLKSLHNDSVFLSLVKFNDDMF